MKFKTLAIASTFLLAAGCGNSKTIKTDFGTLDITEFAKECISLKDSNSRKYETNPKYYLLCEKPAIGNDLKEGKIIRAEIARLRDTPTSSDATPPQSAKMAGNKPTTSDSIKTIPSSEGQGSNAQVNCTNNTWKLQSQDTSLVGNQKFMSRKEIISVIEKDGIFKPGYAGPTMSMVFDLLYGKYCM